MTFTQQSAQIVEFFRKRLNIEARSLTLDERVCMDLSWMAGARVADIPGGRRLREGDVTARMDGRALDTLCLKPTDLKCSRIHRRVSLAAVGTVGACWPCGGLTG